MPPIPSTLDEEIRTQVQALERRQTDLRDFQIPRLRTCNVSLSIQQQYAAELREDIEAFSRQIELLDIAVEDQKGERNRKELRRIVDEFMQALVSLRKDSRTALLASKRAIDVNRSSNREELLRSNVIREKQDLNEKVAEDAVMTASNNITDTLQRTITLMQGELEKSVLSTQLLDASTASLRSASTTHDVLDGLLSTSKYLITALEKSDWVDRLVIMAALIFFVLVVLFILKQRLVDKGIRLAFWWTRFIPSFSSSADDRLVEALEKGSLTTAATEITSVVITTALTAVASSLVQARSADSSLSSLSPSTAIPTLLPDGLIPPEEIVTTTEAIDPTGSVLSEEPSSSFDPSPSSEMLLPSEPLVADTATKIHDEL